MTLACKEATGDKKEVLNKFLTIVDKTFSLDSKFKNVFKSTLSEIIDVLKPIILNSQSKVNKEILIIARYLLVCINPYVEFDNSSFDFNKFYEDIESVTEDELRQAVLKKF